MPSSPNAIGQSLPRFRVCSRVVRASDDSQRFDLMEELQTSTCRIIARSYKASRGDVDYFVQNDTTITYRPLPTRVFSNVSMGCQFCA